MSLRDQLSANPFLEYCRNIFYQKNFGRNDPFEKAYIELRNRENRILTDDVIRRLPDVNDSHPNKKEWDMRKASLNRLIQDLRKVEAKRILELGCGNGWLSHNIATTLKVEVCAIDINETELVQGARVFSDDEKFCFVHADVFGPVFPPNMFDTIVLGSSIQYFPNLESLFGRLFDLLVPEGRIYIIDSPLYPSKLEAEEARKRSLKHFNSLNVAAMADRYFHHTFDDLRKFNYDILYNPKTLTSRLRRQLLGMSISVFPLICIRKVQSHLAQA